MSDRLLESFYHLEKQVLELTTENKQLRELARLRAKLLVCYRVGKNPSGELLDKLYILGKFEETLSR